MTIRTLRACALAVLLGLGLVGLLFLPALAQGGAPGRPAAGKGPTPTATPKTPPTPAGPGPSLPAALAYVDFSSSSYLARGAHPGETITYSLIVVNSGNTPALHTLLQASLPANASYVPGSVQVQGGGALSLVGKNLQWTGAIANGALITITYRAQLPAALGAVVSTTASVFDPGAAAVQLLNNQLIVQAPSGGPDPFGYTYRDSLAPSNPVAFSWVPTTTPASKLDFGIAQPDDEVSGPVSIGFTFLFYTGTYTQTYISTNGLVMFGAQNANNTDNEPLPIPSLNGSHNFASCLFADLFEFDGQQGIWVETHGLAPNRTLVITYRTAYFDAQGAPPGLFQMILSEGSNQIKCQYAQMPGPSQASGGGSAIGLANANGQAGLQYAYSAPDSPVVPIGPIEDGLAIAFTRDPAPRPLYATSQVLPSFSVHPGDTQTVTLAVRNIGNANGAATTVDSPIPAGLSFVPASAHVLGGGALSASAAGIHWSGVVTAGQSITITFRLHLPTSLGFVFTDTATIQDPQASAPLHIANLNPMRVLPPTSGGPDSFGYTFKDSFAPTNPVTFSWVPTSTPTSKLDFGQIQVDDAFTGPVPIGFAFSFYGHVYTETFVDSNGLISFGYGTNELDNHPIPGPGFEETNFAACLWMDLYENDANQGVWVETHGLSPNRYTVITYRTTFFADKVTPPATFQMILYEGSNQIKCQYLDMSASIFGSGGPQATVGLENDDGASGVQYFYAPEADNGAQAAVGPLEAGLAILFKPGPASVASLALSTKAVAPLVHAGERLTYTLVAANDGNLAASPATLDDPIPPGASYIANSAHLVGGGLLTADNTHVHWSGALPPGGVVTVTFAVHLPAAGVVTNTASFSAPQAQAPIVRAVATLVHPAAALGVGQPTYSYADSYAPGIGYSWIVVTATGQHVNTVLVGNISDGYTSIPLGFAFPYFGHVYSNTLVSTNGLVMFNNLGTVQALTPAIPTPGQLVDNYATCFGLDQAIDNPIDSGFWYQTFGAAPNRYTAITFVLQDDSYVTATLTYQMILYEDGRLKCQYQDMLTSPNGAGSLATIGVEGPLGDSGVQYTANPTRAPLTGPVEDGLAILFEPAKELFLPVLSK